MNVVLRNKADNNLSFLKQLPNILLCEYLASFSLVSSFKYMFQRLLSTSHCTCSAWSLIDLF